MSSPDSRLGRLAVRPLGQRQRPVIVEATGTAQACTYHPERAGPEGAAGSEAFLPWLTPGVSRRSVDEPDEPATPRIVFAGEAPFEQPKGRCRRPLLSEL